MMMRNVMIAPQPRHRGNREQKPSAGTQPHPQGPQRAGLIIQMLEHVRHHHQVEELIAERDLIRQRAERNLGETASARETNRTLIRVDCEQPAAAREHREISTSAASGLQDCGVGGQLEAIQNAIDDRPARREPPVRVLNLGHPRI